MTPPSAWKAHLRLAKRPLNRSTLQEIEQIRDVLAKYSYFVDSRQFDLYRSIFTDGCEFVNVAMGRSIKGKEAIIKFMKGQAKEQKTVPASSKHHQSNLLARVNKGGTRAGAVCYFHAFSPLRAEHGGQLVVWGGWYAFELVKKRRDWMISKATVNRRFEIKIPGLSLRGPGELPPEVGF